MTSLDTLDARGFWNVSVNPAEPNELIACGTDRLYRTTDGGVVWNRLESPPEDMTLMNNMAIDWTSRILYVIIYSLQTILSVFINCTSNLFDVLSFSGIGQNADTANDPRFASEQWNLKSDKLKMENAWDITTGSSEIVLAIIDSGTEYDHRWS